MSPSRCDARRWLKVLKLSFKTTVAQAAVVFFLALSQSCVGAVGTSGPKRPLRKKFWPSGHSPHPPRGPTQFGDRALFCRRNLRRSQHGAGRSFDQEEQALPRSRALPAVKREQAEEDNWSEHLGALS
ncbi:exported hypothetical protein [Thiomonas sp. CB2]|nr:exported hypothetical protein [Thiomonas sp. CB2]VDY06163.1 exported protein of unknown function [Thiomonas sp. Bio17B3]